MYDHDDWDPDITGDPMLDQTGYESSRRPSLHPVRWDAVAQLAQQQREQRGGVAATAGGEAGAAGGG
jgi:hypothetical protein